MFDCFNIFVILDIQLLFFSLINDISHTGIGFLIEIRPRLASQLKAIQSELRHLLIIWVLLITNLKIWINDVDMQVDLIGIIYDDLRQLVLQRWLGHLLFVFGLGVVYGLEGAIWGWLVLWWKRLLRCLVNSRLKIIPLTFHLIIWN